MNDDMACPNEKCGGTLQLINDGYRVGGSGPGPLHPQPGTATAYCSSCSTGFHRPANGGEWTPVT